jgi:hypothetical protein
MTWFASPPSANHGVRSREENPFTMALFVQGAVVSTFRSWPLKRIEE